MNKYFHLCDFAVLGVIFHGFLYQNDGYDVAFYGEVVFVVCFMDVCIFVNYDGKCPKSLDFVDHDLKISINAVIESKCQHAMMMRVYKSL
ncbi:hypothetical protein L4D06_16380 [Enterovibrio makurazakiensis]|uniref:hypothetical protein n=1 Tax=Enterovibrio makurazakiensis TaxID=2910232 RepID=UPI003D1E5527